MSETEKKGAERINPYSESDAKGKQVERMFDSIAPAYDFMNTAMSFGLHRRWRDRALDAATLALRHLAPPERVLDVATGTGDVAFALHKRFPDASVKGIDLSNGMLKIAREKFSRMPVGERGNVSFEAGDCLNLRFDDDTFSLITVAYGVRNFEQLEKGLREMWRVLEPGGVLCIVELSVPRGKLTGAAYRLYAGKLIPMVGRLVSGDSRAYSYLPESIAACRQREDMTALMRKAGFRACRWKSLTFGAVTYYLGIK